MKERLMPKKLTYAIPAGARGSARKALRWKEEHGSEVDGMLAAGWTRANQLVNDRYLSRDTAKRVKSFFARHGANAETFDVDPALKDTPWKDNGYIAYLGWGGGSMEAVAKNWVFDDE
jgi:hypothetical protein